MYWSRLNRLKKLKLLKAKGIYFVGMMMFGSYCLLELESMQYEDDYRRPLRDFADKSYIPSLSRLERVARDMGHFERFEDLAWLRKQWNTVVFENIQNILRSKSIEDLITLATNPNLYCNAMKWYFSLDYHYNQKDIDQIMRNFETAGNQNDHNMAREFSKLSQTYFWLYKNDPSILDVYDRMHVCSDMILYILAQKIGLYNATAIDWKVYDYDAILRKVIDTFTKINPWDKRYFGGTLCYQINQTKKTTYDTHSNRAIASSAISFIESTNPDNSRFMNWIMNAQKY